MPTDAKTLWTAGPAAAAFLLLSAGAAAASGQIPLCPPPGTPLTAPQRSALAKTAAQCRAAFNQSDAHGDCQLGQVEGVAAPYAECAQCASIRITCTYTAHGKEKKFGINGYKASTDTLEDLTKQGIRTSPVQQY